MLEFFRRHVGGGLLGVLIIGALVVAFSLSFGAQSKGWGAGQEEQIVAAVEGEDISFASFRYAFNLVGGRDMERNDPNYVRLQRSVVEGLVERQLLLALADDIGVSASQDEAEQRIVKDEVFLTRPVMDLLEYLSSNMFIDQSITSQVLVTEGHRVRQSFRNAEGRFDLEMYRNFVRYYLQMTEEMFVEQQRLELIAERMRQIIASSIRVSPAEVRELYEREHDTAAVEYVRLIPSYFGDSLEPKPEEIAAFAVAHSEEIKKEYEAKKFRYTNLEKMVRARHILIKVGENATPEEKAGARAKIDGLLARARAGEDFAALARENSEDEGSKAKGGDLGFAPRGRMVPAFEEAMFAAAPGSITDVVETPYGYHIIKVEETREGNVSLEQATPELAIEIMRTTQGKDLAKAKADEILARLKAGETMAAVVPEQTGAAADDLSLKARVSRPFARTDQVIPGIGAAKEIVEAAFAATDSGVVLDKAFEIRGEYVVARLAERNKPNDAEFAELEDSVTEKLASIKQGAWLRDRIDELKLKSEKEGRLERNEGFLAMEAPAPAQKPAGDEAAGGEKKTTTQGKRPADAPKTNARRSAAAGGEKARASEGEEREPASEPEME